MAGDCSATNAVRKRPVLSGSIENTPVFTFNVMYQQDLQPFSILQKTGHAGHPIADLDTWREMAGFGWFSRLVSVLRHKQPRNNYLPRNTILCRLAIDQPPALGPVTFYVYVLALRCCCNEPCEVTL
jgi:hypothetical protein